MPTLNQKGEVQAVELDQLLTWQQSSAAAAQLMVWRAAQPEPSYWRLHLQDLLCPPISLGNWVHPTG